MVNFYESLLNTGACMHLQNCVFSTPCICVDTHTNETWRPFDFPRKRRVIQSRQTEFIRVFPLDEIFHLWDYTREYSKLSVENQMRSVFGNGEKSKTISKFELLKHTNDIRNDSNPYRYCRLLFCRQKIPLIKIYRQNIK